jgi:hypothetical protein
MAKDATTLASVSSRSPRDCPTRQDVRPAIPPDQYPRGALDTGQLALNDHPPVASGPPQLGRANCRPLQAPVLSATVPSARTT